MELAEDAPSVSPPKPGDLAGRVRPTADILRLSAVSRVTGKTYTPSEFDKRTGQFRFKNLPGDANYDIRLETTDGRRIEGIDDVECPIGLMRRKPHR